MTVTVLNTSRQSITFPSGRVLGAGETIDDLAPIDLADAHVLTMNRTGLLRVIDGTLPDGWLTRVSMFMRDSVDPVPAPHPVVDGLSQDLFYALTKSGPPMTGHS